MNEAGIKAAISEAERFVKAARAVLAERSGSGGSPGAPIWRPSKTNSACRRASLDAARALAEMRKP